MLGLKLNHVNKRGHCWTSCRVTYDMRGHDVHVASLSYLVSYTLSCMTKLKQSLFGVSVLPRNWFCYGSFLPGDSPLAILFMNINVSNISSIVFLVFMSVRLYVIQGNPFTTPVRNSHVSYYGKAAVWCIATFMICPIALAIASYCIV